MLNVPSYRQTSGFCGPACLKMVLAYFDIEKTEEDLARLCGASRRHGTNAQGIIKAAEKLGFKARLKNAANFTDIKKYLRQGIPVIVDWFSQDDGHYSVAVDITDKNIHLQDPELGALRMMDLKTFQRVWFDFPNDYLRSKNDLILRRIIIIWPSK